MKKRTFLHLVVAAFFLPLSPCVFAQQSNSSPTPAPSYTPPPVWSILVDDLPVTIDVRSIESASFFRFVRKKPGSEEKQPSVTETVVKNAHNQPSESSTEAKDQPELELVTVLRIGLKSQDQVDFYCVQPYKPQGHKQSDKPQTFGGGDSGVSAISNQYSVRLVREKGASFLSELAMQTGASDLEEAAKKYYLEEDDAGADVRAGVSVFPTGNLRRYRLKCIADLHEVHNSLLQKWLLCKSCGLPEDAKKKTVEP